MTEVLETETETETGQTVPKIEVEEKEVPTLVHGEEKAGEIVGNIMNYFVGVSGNEAFQVVCTQSPSVVEIIESVATIEINSIAALITDDMESVELVNMYIKSKREIANAALTSIIDSAETLSDDIKEKLKEELKAL